MKKISSLLVVILAVLSLNAYATSEEGIPHTKIKKVLPEVYKDIAALIDKGEYDKAELLARERRSLNKKDYAAVIQLGQALWEKHERKKAQKAFKRAVTLRPESAPAYFLLGRSYFFSRQYDKAKGEFKTFMERMESIQKMDEPTINYYTDRLHQICFMYTSLKRYDNMLELYKKAVKLKPDNQVFHYNTAVCYYNLKKVRTAYFHLNKTIEIDDSSHTAKRAKLFIDYIRKNPDPRFEADVSFIFDE